MYTFPLALGLGVFITVVSIRMTEAVPSATQRMASTGYGRTKGDLGDLLQAVPRSSSSWRNLGANEDLPSYRNKGDDAVLDPRGSVRYNVLPSGRISKGIITALGDEETTLVQATGESYTIFFHCIQSKNRLRHDLDYCGKQIWVKFFVCTDNCCQADTYSKVGTGGKAE